MTWNFETPWSDLTIYVAGHRGLVGSAIWRALEQEDVGRLVGFSSHEADLRDASVARDVIAQTRPDIVIDAAARVGGIVANSTYPVEFQRDNILIQTNLMDAAHAAGVERLLFLGSSCIYPRMASQPINEWALMNGPLEPTNQSYAIAKIAGIFYIEAYRQEYGRHWISAMPTNLYGPRDNFDPESSHVPAAFIRRFHEAKLRGAPTVTMWGSGSPKREFLHVDDLARACLILLEKYDSSGTVNVGVGADISIKDFAELVRDVVGYEGQITWDREKPDGMPRKLLDVSRMESLGWRPQIPLGEGLRATYDWYVRNEA